MWTSHPKARLPSRERRVPYLISRTMGLNQLPDKHTRTWKKESNSKGARSMAAAGEPGTQSRPSGDDASRFCQAQLFQHCGSRPACCSWNSTAHRTEAKARIKPSHHPSVNAPVWKSSKGVSLGLFNRASKPMCSLHPTTSIFSP